MSNRYLVTGKPHISTDAYAIKESHGGGFRGWISYLTDSGTETEKSDRMDSLDAAGRWALNRALELIGSDAVHIGHYRGNRYKKNYWFAA